jgi:hypothetical protein
MKYFYAPVFLEMDDIIPNRIISRTIGMEDPVVQAEGVPGGCYYYSSSREEYLIKALDDTVAQSNWTEHSLIEAQTDFPSAF